MILRVLRWFWGESFSRHGFLYPRGTSDDGMHFWTINRSKVAMPRGEPCACLPGPWSNVSTSKMRGLTWGSKGVSTENQPFNHLDDGWFFHYLNGWFLNQLNWKTNHQMIKWLNGWLISFLKNGWFLHFHVFRGLLVLDFVVFVWRWGGVVFAGLLLLEAASLSRMIILYVCIPYYIRIIIYS